jgi:hypothetical protein
MTCFLIVPPYLLLPVFTQDAPGFRTAANESGRTTIFSIHCPAQTTESTQAAADSTSLDFIVPP